MRFVAFIPVLVACSSSSSERVYSLEDLELEKFIGLPVSGDGRLVVSKSLISPTNWSNVRGHATFVCEGCALGDDHTTLKDFVWAPPEGLQFGHLALGEIDGRADFGDGHVKARMSVRSEDLEIVVRVDGVLANRKEDVTLNGCIQFRPADALRERDPRMHALLSVTGAESDDAGWFYISLEGPVGELRRYAKRCEAR